MIDRWIIDWTRDQRLPYYTRANAGEVLPEPVSPLGWTLVFEEGLLPGWLRGFVEFRSLEPVEILWGPYQGGSACYLRDPDGISVELLQPPPGGPAL